MDESTAGEIAQGILEKIVRRDLVHLRKESLVVTCAIEIDEREYRYLREVIYDLR